ncbi:tRNA (adenine(37)-N6)-methyltransferase isoform X2 [Myripristis murdjan]|uniref:tRNA (adenine(37)-N6)-methyltransferase n=1 Tax=Myripristis murdjan TaxID=586833 RepID=A0A667ZWN6_9TELE|nr:tRNA (adenine(37)-N6)-methyltransferase isoform X2 [Myripristis murdjan]
MCPMCDGCGDHVSKLNQQVSVMRREIKNLRQMLDSAVRAHRKHMVSVQSAVTNLGHCGLDRGQSPPSSEPALDKGNIQTVPIGYISSCFLVKNGTPRQPAVCGPSRATLRIQQTVFNNPEHALVGLEHFSHVWIIFLFHKNGHLSYKAKVKPPRLNGQRVGVYSTRSPHRPNATGLTLAKLDRIVGDTLHLSGIDMIDGTPVLDIKPYIPEYDSPHVRMGMGSELHESNTDQPKVASESLNEAPDTLNLHEDLGADAELNLKSEGNNSCQSDDPRSSRSRDKSETDTANTNNSSCSSSPTVGTRPFLPKDLHSVLEEVKAFVTQDDFSQLSSEAKDEGSDSTVTKQLDSMVAERVCYGEDAYSTIAGWIREPPVASLEVRFTPHAEKELAKFLPPQPSGPSESDRPRFRFLRGPEEAAAAIRGVLSADPRSVYRRTRCGDKLFFFTLDTADITCWFGPDFVEVLQVRSVEHHSPSL